MADDTDPRAVLERIIKQNPQAGSEKLLRIFRGHGHRQSGARAGYSAADLRGRAGGAVRNPVSSASVLILDRA
jgi:hypothetical protein